MYVCKYQHLLVGIFVRCYVVHNRGYESFISGTYIC